MEAILNSVEPVVKSSQFVSINKVAIASFAETVTDQDFGGSEWQEDTVIKDLPQEQQTALPIVYSALNFCYWGDLKWTVKVGDHFHDGSAAMLRVLVDSVKCGQPLLDPHFLADISPNLLRKLFVGNKEIPLFNERLEILRSLGQTVSQQFAGSFRNIIAEGEWNATKIVELLVANFPTVFKDEADYNGLNVRLYKRAQLVPGYIADLARQGLISRNIQGLENLTAFADYKVPQLLRHFGILEYTDDLAKRVDAKIEIPSGSNEEIEIRANTIWAVDMTTRQLKRRFPDVTAAEVDGIFWFKGQSMKVDKPYHRTRTIWY